MKNDNYERAPELLVKLLEIMVELRDKCPWDKKQTFDTLRKLTIEETYELADAIIRKDMKSLKDELGDLMLHIVFYARVAEQQGAFNIEDVIETNKKERHDDADLLLSLMQIKEIETHKDEAAKKLGLSGGKEFAFFGLIDRSEDLPALKKEERAAIAKEIITLVEDRAVAEWTEREDIQKEMRREIKRLLRSKGCAEEKLPALTRELIELAQQWIKR